MSCAAVEDAQPVVVGVGVGESLAFDLFDDEVSALGRAVGEPGVEVGEDLCLPLAQGAREAVGLLDVIDGGPAVPVGELALGLAAAGAVVEVSQGLFEDPRRLEVEGVVGVERGLEALPAPLCEALLCSGEVPARRVEGVVFGALVPGEFLLDPAAGVGEGLVGEALDVEPVSDVHRVRQQLAHRGPIGANGSITTASMAAAASPRVRSRSAGAALERPSNMSHILEVSRSTMPVMNLRGRRNVVSSTPMRRGGAGGRAASLADAAAATAPHARARRVVVNAGSSVGRRWAKLLAASGQLHERAATWPPLGRISWPPTSHRYPN